MADVSRQEKLASAKKKVEYILIYFLQSCTGGFHLFSPKSQLCVDGHDGQSQSNCAKRAQLAWV